MRFREWCKLNESVSVVVQRPREEWDKNVPEDLNALSYKLMAVVDQIVPMGAEQIAPDGDDWDKTKGTMNLYMKGPFPQMSKEEIPKDMIRPVLGAIRQYLDGLGAKMGEPKKESYVDALSRDLKRSDEDQVDRIKKHYHDMSDGQLDKTRVLRLPIEISPEAIKAADMPPEVNMGFPVAKIVFEEIFGLPSAGPDPVGGLVAALQAPEPEEGEEWKTAGKPEPEQEQGFTGYDFNASDIISTYERLVQSGDLRNWASMYTQKMTR